MPTGFQVAAVKDCLPANQVFQNILPRDWHCRVSGLQYFLGSSKCYLWARLLGHIMNIGCWTAACTEIKLGRPWACFAVID